MAELDASNQMAGRASMITRWLFKLLPDLRDANCALLILNQARANFSQYGDEIIVPGGVALQHQSDIRIRMLAQDRLKVGDDHGFAIKGKVKKNKTAATRYKSDGKSEQEFQVSIMTNPTYHWPANDLFGVAVDLGVFSTASGEVYEGRGTVCFQETELGSSRDKARLALGQDVDLYTAVEAAAYSRMRSDSKEKHNE